MTGISGLYPCLQQITVHSSPSKRSESALKFYSWRPEDKTEELFSNLENTLDSWYYYVLVNIHPSLGVGLIFVFSPCHVITGKASALGVIRSPTCHSPLSRLSWCQEGTCAFTTTPHLPPERCHLKKLPHPLPAWRTKVQMTLVP